MASNSTVDCSNTNCIQNKLDSLVLKLYECINKVPDPDEYKKQYNDISKQIYNVLNNDELTETNFNNYSKYLSSKHKGLLNERLIKLAGKKFSELNQGTPIKTAKVKKEK